MHVKLFYLFIILIGLLFQIPFLHYHLEEFNMRHLSGSKHLHMKIAVSGSN